MSSPLTGASVRIRSVLPLIAFDFICFCLSNNFARAFC
jgi:hypothetical protein